MNYLEVGQVLSLKIRFNNSGTISQTNHPYLIIDIDTELNTVEIAQIDSLAGKEYKAAFKSNKVIYCTDPVETVIDKDSYIQMDNTIKIEMYHDLVLYRRQTDKLSQSKLADVLKSYKAYHNKYQIDENKQVYIDKSELESLQ